MVYLTRKAEFSASHYYHNPALSPEENQRLFGKCNNPNGHGHNYTLEVTVRGKVDPRSGFVVDLKQLKDIMHREVLDALDHRFLNKEIPEFSKLIPTTENLAVTIWQRLAPKLPDKRGRWWQMWLEPRRLATAGAVLVLVVAAFVAGRITKPVRTDTTAAATQQQVRERILVVAVGEHLGKSEMVLVELANAEPQDAKQKHVNISAEQRRAGDLLEENRMYRQTALQQGDTGLASVLDDLERVLVDVAHSPDEVTPAQLESIQKRIEAHGILFKVRVVGKELQRRQDDMNTAPAQGGQQARERNKT